MKTKSLGKKELKKFINENGFFYSMAIEVKKNAPQDYASKVPEGATYFEGIVSNGELNRNGYIIRPQALIDSLNTFMMNPVILLQHETDEPIGHCLSAELRGSGETQEVFVRGYVFDDLTGGRFGRNLFSGLSTGHITLAIEFQNSKTGEILSEEDFRKFNWEEQMNGDWIMCVTKLEWVEFSLVAIGSVRKAVVTAKNAIEAYVSTNKLCEESLRKVTGNEAEAEETTQPKEEKPAEAPAPEEKKEETQTTTTEQPAPAKEAENSGENPEAKTEKPAEKSGEVESAKEQEKVEDNKVKISKVDREKLKAASDLLLKTLEATIEADEEEKEEKPEVKDEAKPEGEKPAEQAESKPQLTEENTAKIEVPALVKSALETLVSLNSALEAEVLKLKEELSKIPNRKGLAMVTQFNSPKEEQKPQGKGSALVNFLRSNGFNV